MDSIKNILPKSLINFLRPIYHYKLALLGALVYRFPSRKIKVVAVTGTKGKSTVTELVNAILEEAGFKTALANTLKFKINGKEERNLFKMTMPGRFFLQRFLRKAVSAGCQYAVIEMTSEGAKQFRHKFISLDALLFTNISPEHIESHGSYENYLNAKLKIAKALSHSPKRPRIVVVNLDDREATGFLEISADKKILYSIQDAEDYQLGERKTKFVYKDHKIEIALPGLFNIYNALAAIKYAETQNVDLETIKKAIGKIKTIRGRTEFVDCGQNFDVVVDYAHTADSLEKFYKVFNPLGDSFDRDQSEPLDKARDKNTNKRKLICVLGNTGGGRDKWKRPEMGRLADKYCDMVILTNEDPYDENPKKIIDEMAVSVQKEKLKIILDRREAVRLALREAKELAHGRPEKNTVVLITGKGTDPYIMGPNGTKTPWDDAQVVREELEKLK